MLRNKYLTNFLTIIALIFCVTAGVSAQQNVADKNTLANFEKSIEQGKYAEVERDLLNYAIKNPTDAQVFELLGKLRLAQNRLGEAKSLFQKALSLNANSILAKINLAIVNVQTGNRDQAAADLNEITDKDVFNDDWRLKLANAFALVSNCEKALKTIEKLAVRIKNSDALPVRAECFLQSGDKQKASALIPAAKNLAKQNPAIAIKFAEILSDAAMYKESADVLHLVAANAPNNADVLILLAKTEIYAKDLTNAKIHLNQASKINPDSPDLLFVKGLLESEQGNAAQSLDLLEKSLAANPNSATVLSQYIVSAMRAGYAGKAFGAAEKLLELKPDKPEFLYLYGASALQSNNLAAAENALRRFAELRPKDSRGCLALGLTYAAKPENLEVARNQFKHCLEANPNNFEANYQLGLSYKTQGEPAKAIEYLEATVKSSPKYALALRDLGAVYLQTGAESKAKIALEKAVALNPNDADAHFQLSRLYNLTGAKDLAQKHLEIFQKLKNQKKDGM